MVESCATYKVASTQYPIFPTCFLCFHVQYFIALTYWNQYPLKFCLSTIVQLSQVPFKNAIFPLT